MLSTLGECDIGAALVGATLNAEWAQRLTPTERLVLIAMAHTALDPGQTNGRAPCEYWNGHESLMLTVLGDLPRGSTAHSNGLKLIQRAIGKLLKEGAVELLSSGRRGHRARYKITLGFPQPVDNVRLLPVRGTLMSP